MTNKRYYAGVPEMGFRFFMPYGAYITAFPNGNTFISKETITASTVDSNANCFLSCWQRISVTFPVTASASGTSFNIRFQSSAKSGTVWFAAPQVEKGDIVGLIDNTGALVVEYKYDAWGNPTATRTLTTAYDALAELNPFRYRGYVWDEENQFLYLNSRYYSPMLLRFINADIILNDENKVCYRSLFTYCTNNPTNKVDVYGYRSTSLLNTSPFCMYSAEEALGKGGGYVGGSGTGIAILGGLGLIFSWFAGEKIADKAASSSSSIASTNSSFSATTVEEQLAQTAGRFGNLQCFLAKDAMLALLLKMNLHGSVIELTFPGDYVWSITYSRTISENGRHVGILYKGKVYCNVHPYGLPKEKWINDFDSANGEPLITEIPF